MMYRSTNEAGDSSGDHGNNDHKTGIASIDLNCDMGEGIGTDELIMPFITSASIACGYHAGNEETMSKTIELAIGYNVQIGAHVSFADRDNFGRKEMEVPGDELYRLVDEQLQLIMNIADRFRVKIRHVKPHGALYNMSSRDARIANTVALAVKNFDDSLILFGLSGSHSVKEANALGLATANEVFADRTYQDDGSLTPRSLPNAMIDEAATSIKQVIGMIKQGTVRSVSGKTIPIQADTLCIHGDGPNAVEFANGISRELKNQGILVRAIV